MIKCVYNLIEPGHMLDFFVCKLQSFCVKGFDKKKHRDLLKMAKLKLKLSWNLFFITKTNNNTQNNTNLQVFITIILDN